MSADTRCFHCRNTPVIRVRNRKGTKRCPLCKTETLTNESGTFVCERLPPVSLGAKMVVGGIFVAILVVTVGSLYLFARTVRNADFPSDLQQVKLEIDQPPAKINDSESKRIAYSQSKSTTTTSIEKKPRIPAQIEQEIEVANQPAAEPIEHPSPIKPTDLGVTSESKKEANEPEESTSKKTWQSTTLPDHELEWEFSVVPEIGVWTTPSPSNNHSSNIYSEKQKEANKYAVLLQLAKAHKDKLINHLLKKNPELNTLPLQLGKECVLDKDQAKVMDECSQAIRQALTKSTGRNSIGAEWANPTSFWYHAGPSLIKASKTGRYDDSLVPALHQTLTGEGLDVRHSYVAKLSHIKGLAATKALVNRAIFDTSKDCRKLAMAALKERPEKDYRKELLDGLRYPWPSVAGRASDAIVALKLNSVVPELIDMLEEDDPNAPFQKTIDGKDVWHMKKLVRINHFRNCLLCHAPSFSKQDLVRNVPPVPGCQLTRVYPRRLLEESSISSRLLIVRADITYLKQDFSLLQPVKNTSPWPRMQRFDFVVQTRRVTEAEHTLWQLKKKRYGTPYKSAIRSALWGLTGEDAGMDANAWRELITSPYMVPNRSPNMR